MVGLILDEREAYLWSSVIENLDILNVLNILKTPPPSHLNLHSLFKEVNTALGSCRGAGCQVSKYSVVDSEWPDKRTCGFESGKQAQKGEEEMEEEKQEGLRASK